MDDLQSLSPHFSAEELQGPVLAWYRSNKEAHPWRVLWEEFRDPYFVWISEIMLQQTTLAAVLPKYKSFLKRFPKVEDLALASEAQIKAEVQGLGYYRRFSNLHKGTRQLLENSKAGAFAWPKNYDEWLKVSGVGDYTAAAISSITLNAPIPVLDGNVIRVFARIFDLQRPANDLALAKVLKTLAFHLVSQQDPGSYNQALMELGQKICRPLNPSCGTCPVQKICLASARQTTHLAPQAKTRSQTENVQVRIQIVQKGKAFGIVARNPKSKFLRGTAGFVTEICNKKQFSVDGEDFTLPKEAYLGTFKHSITKHRLSVEVFLVAWQKSWEKQFEESRVHWLPKSEVDKHLVASLDIKAWKLLAKRESKLSRPQPSMLF